MLLLLGKFCVNNWSFFGFYFRFWEIHSYKNRIVINLYIYFKLFISSLSEVFSKTTVLKSRNIRKKTDITEQSFSKEDVENALQSINAPYHSHLLWEFFKRLLCTYFSEGRLLQIISSNLLFKNMRITWSYQHWQL